MYLTASLASVTTTARLKEQHAPGGRGSMVLEPFRVGLLGIPRAMTNGSIVPPSRDAAHEVSRLTPVESLFIGIRADATVLIRDRAPSEHRNNLGRHNAGLFQRINWVA